MIIRSQSGLIILNFNNIMNLYVDGTAICVTEITKKYYPIADYSTEEKAIKVLDMIQNEYFTHMTVVDNAGVTVGILERPKVFQMPQDSEV